MGIFLNSILGLNKTTQDNLVLQNKILLNNPKANDTTAEVYENSTDTQKTAFFIIANGMRNIRTQSETLSNL
jgi:hypothetical protein